MPDEPTIAAPNEPIIPGQWRAMLENFLPRNASREETIRSIEAALESPMGQSMRDTMASWIVDEIVPVKSLVPETYEKWRPPVRDAMVFVIARLSPARLAPKLLEQIELPTSTTAEARLLRLIAKVPGLQKLGQVIARNQHLSPALRKALARLENGIRDVKPADIEVVIRRELSERLAKFDVKISSAILSEASVSAVVRFTWRNPKSGRRERGVFKILKPHIPEFFAEDMDYLQGLAEYFGERHHSYGFAPGLIPDTFKKVRRLLQHEVNFSREQKTLIEARNLYRTFPKVRIPGVIRELCTRRLTALTEERGVKITTAAVRLKPAARRQVAEQLLEALIAVPLLSSQKDAVFHGDPHAGNLLYDVHTGTLAIIDWALRERLGREQRRHLALLFLMVSLRDPIGTSSAIVALSQRRLPIDSPRERLVSKKVSEFLTEMPASTLPSAADAMRLLERVAIAGIKFPGSLIMLSKVMFTLEGLLSDIAGADAAKGFTIVRHAAQHWIANRSAYRSPLEAKDWFVLQSSMLLYPSRLWLRWEQKALDRLTRKSSAPVAATGT